MEKKLYKKLGIALLVIPLLFLLIFTIGEIISGDIYGLGHLIQAIPIVLLLILALKKPTFAGVLLIVGGGLFGMWYAINAPFPLITILLVESILVVLPIISGILLIRSAKN